MDISRIEKIVLDNLPLSEQDKFLLNRRINKLKKDPKSFFETSYKKRSKQVIDKLPIKYTGRNNFTVVSAVYNVERYLNDYFQSLTDQSISFKKNIHLIMVDDGSTDNSAEIIREWQKKYPHNIRYFHKENGGQASARNLGLEHVETEWVTFIDPDDFVDKQYFKVIDDELEKDDSISMIVSNLKFFIEDENIIQDRHPLRFRFENTSKKFSSLDLKDFMNLSAAATIFKTNSILKNKIEFNSNIRPNFEDGKLIADYLLFDSGEVVFLKNSVYLYRKRSDKSSTVDTSWKNVQKYNDVLKHGYVAMLEKYDNSLGYVPRHIQRTVLYDVSWYLRLLVNHSEKIDFLTKDEKNNFYDLISYIFSYIDSETILSFSLAGIWFAHKVGILGAFKNERQQNQIAYIENIDREKKQILISYFTYFDVVHSVQLDEEEVIPRFEKTVENTFVNKLFVKEKRLWVPFDDKNSLFRILIDNRSSRISLKGTQHSKGILVRDILEAFQPSVEYKTDGSWLIMDRDTQADDNAEHFCRYMMKEHPKQKCYFALRRDSHDWERLHYDGFNLVEFGSDNFEARLKSASKIISSHLDKYVNNYFGDEYEYSKKFVFLQHGVIMNDLSNWFSSKKNLQCLVTTTIPEYHSIVDNNTRYKLTEKEVVLTGLPRHDSLIENNQQDSQTILIMPTWRQSIMGKVVGIGNNRSLNQDFMTTEYAQHWHQLLNSERFAHLVKVHGYKVIFAPHANIEPYMDMFSIPDYINLWKASDTNTSMQELFQQSKLMITDYSSVAFEMGILNKTVLYYQFDKDEVFSGTHLIQRGYFSYEKDGFGPVVTELEELLAKLDSILANNGAPIEPYATRIENTFAYHDTNNCQRVYQAIMNLDRPDSGEIDIDILNDMIVSAYNNRAWPLVESRVKLLANISSDKLDLSHENLLTEALFYQNKFVDLFEHLDKLNITRLEKDLWQVKVAFVTSRWHEAIHILEAMPKLNHDDTLILINSYANTQNVKQFEKLRVTIDNKDSDNVLSTMIEAWSYLAHRDWQAIIDLLDDEIVNFDEDALKDYQPQLLLARAHRHLLEFAEAHKQLSDFEIHTENNIKCCIEIASLAFVRDNYEKTIGQYEKAVDDIALLPEFSIMQYLQALWHMNYTEKLLETLLQVMSVYPDNQSFSVLYIETLARDKQWLQVLEGVLDIDLNQYAEMVYPVTLARYRLGHIEEAYDNCIKPTSDHDYKYWHLVSEIALLQEDFELAKYCLKGMIAIFPDKDNQDHWSKLESIRGYT